MDQTNSSSGSNRRDHVIWGPNAEKNTHYLWVYMTHLRQKLEADPHVPKFLRTEAGIGYRLEVAE